MVSCFIIKGFVLFAVKTVSSFFLLDADERDGQHIVALIINILSTDFAAMVAYQFIIVSYCAKCRYEVLVAYAKQYFNDFRYRICVVDSDDNFEFIENLWRLNFRMATVLEHINATLSKEVKGEFTNYEIYFKELRNLWTLPKRKNFIPKQIIEIRIFQTLIWPEPNL